MVQPEGKKLTPKRPGMQEGGLLLVILVLGLILAVFGGSVERPKLQTNSLGEKEKVYATNAQGESVPVMERKNKFFNPENLAQLAKDTSFIAIMAIGATFIIVSGGIDLSVGAIYALASVLGALVFQKFGLESTGGGAAQPWTGVVLGIGTCLGVALACGFLNGLMIISLKVHPFIITLGTMAIFRGIAFVVTQGQSVGGFPEQFRNLVRYEIVEGLSLVPLLVMILVTVVAGFYLLKMVGGREVYAVGGNELASRFSGIRVGRVKLRVFCLSGLTAGVAALLAIGYYGSASSADGSGYELDVIAAAVIGGASLSGGRGTAFGALLGALIIKMIDNGIIILGIDQNYIKIIIGAAVILAVVLDQVNNWAARRRRV